MAISAAELERSLDLVPSVIFNGVRIRALFDTLLSRPPNETFHEFLIAVIQWTFGESWWRHQLTMPDETRHVVVRWYLACCQLTQDRHEVDRQSDGIHRSIATGPVWALLNFGYDLFCLQVKRHLPEYIVERLQRHASFQAMRYEIAVAAILLRAGLEIEYLDEQKVKEKHGEYIASDRSTGHKFAVEAKTRVRPGVLHASGEFKQKRDVRGLENLIRDALAKKPSDKPYVVFVDVNLPETPNVPLFEKPWVNDIKGVLSLLGTPTPENPERFSLLVVTNFAYHLGANDARAPKPEWIVVLPRFASPSMRPQLVEALSAIINRYGIVPDQL